jgi:hypothetical protein
MPGEDLIARRDRAVELAERLGPALSAKPPLPSGNFGPQTTSGPTGGATGLLGGGDAVQGILARLEGALRQGPQLPVRPFPEQQAAPSGSWPAPLPPPLSVASFPSGGSSPPSIDSARAFPAPLPSPLAHAGMFPAATPPPVAADVSFPSSGAPPAAAPGALPGSPLGGGGEVVELLRRIATAVERIGQGSQAGGNRTASGGAMGQSVFSFTAGEHPDAVEGYAGPASPSVNVSSTGGLRGAGGWGFGSRAPSGQQSRDKEYLEPGHRVPRPGG